jgi:putative acetyltransferase
MEYKITVPAQSDLAAIIALYRDVSQVYGGIIRSTDEITESYVGHFLEAALEKGLIFVAKWGDVVVGEIHAYTPDLHAFRHLLTDLTIVVHPDHQGKGLGKELFSGFLATIRKDFRHILRVELYVRENNRKNVQFYESLGFVNEGRQADKIMRPDGGFETPLHMAWRNPDYQRKD